MLKPIIEAQGLGKKYQIGAEREPYLSLREQLSRSFSPRRFSASAKSQEFWALKDVSFSVQPGETIGIIGRNGAGKSTLLKILSQITPPSEGKIKMRGRIASLLEVGTGFHPELTGRENIYLNGAILGMTRSQVKGSFDQIVAFAEVERFLDTPVKRYSSGMYVRLAFAVAAHLEPEILVVDEVLAVGDAEFQKKCLGKMGDVARAGRTVLFVSHNMAAVEKLCSRCILLSGGRVALDGSVRQALDSYLSIGLHQLGERHWPELSDAPGDDVVRLTAVRVVDQSGAVRSEFSVREPLLLETEFMVCSPGHKLNLNVYVTDDEGRLVFVTGDFQTPRWREVHRPVGKHVSTCTIPGDLLNNGMLRFLVALVEPPDTLHAIEQDALFIHITDDVSPEGARGHYPAEWPGGVIRPALSWNYTHVPNEDSPRGG